MALHTFIRDQQAVSIPASRFRGFQMIAQFLKGGPAQYFFSIVVFEKLSRNVSTKMSWFQCTSWNSLVQLTTSNEPKVAVAVECDAIAVMDFPVGTRKAVPWTMIPCHWVAEVNPKVPSLNEIWHTLARERL